MMKKLTAVLVMLALASSVYAGNNDTPETLAELFIAAVNAKSKEKQKATIHPRCFADLSPSGTWSSGLSTLRTSLKSSSARGRIPAAASSGSSGKRRASGS